MRVYERYYGEDYCILSLSREVWLAVCGLTYQQSMPELYSIDCLLICMGIHIY